MKAAHLLVVHLLFLVYSLVVLSPHKIHVAFQEVVVLNYSFYVLPVRTMYTRRVVQDSVGQKWCIWAGRWAGGIVSLLLFVIGASG